MLQRSVCLSHELTLLPRTRARYVFLVIGWIADSLQLLWGLVYWNARKTRFQLKRGRIPCPCQTPSDSGRAMETGCEPSLLLHRPPRFRRVCPLLKQNSKGSWVCSVDTPHVRPFWGRAAGIFAMMVAVGYVFASGGAWLLLRERGYPISYYDTAWPGAWSHFHQIQSRYFAQKAQRALSDRDVGEAIMSLSIAYQLDPDDFPLGMALAQLTQAGQPAVSDSVYARLARDHPTHRAEVYATWYDGLLWRADFTAIVDVCRRALAIDADHRGAWLNALLFALRREPNEAALLALAKDPDLAALRPVFELELQTLPGGAAARDRLLSYPETPQLPFLNYYRPKRLIELGFAKDALELFRKNKVQIPPRDQFTLQLDAYATLGWTTVTRNEFNSHFGEIDQPAVSDLLTAQLVRHPDPDLFRDAFEAFHQRASKNPNLYRSWAGWLCAAGANGDYARFQIAGSEMKRISSSEFRALTPLERFFRGEGASGRIESYLPAIQPLPLEVTYALLERYYRPRGTRQTL